MIPSAAIESAHLIGRLDRLMRSGVAVEGLNPAQWEALRYLARANRFSRPPAGLADYLGSTRGTVSQTLDSAASPHHCALLDEPLSDADSHGICIEQESAA